MVNKLWDDVRKGLQDLSNIAAEKGKQFTKVAADKAEELTRTGKIRLDILQINRDIERHFSDLGGKVYHLNKNEALDSLSEDTEIQAVIDKVAVLEEKKAALEEKMKEAKQAETSTAESSMDESPADAETETELDSEADTESTEDEEAGV